jgi:hypothetical protein
MRVVALAGVLAVLLTACDSSGTEAPTTSVKEETTTSASSPETTTTTTPPSTSTTTVPLPEPIEGWQPPGSDPDVFGSVTITDADISDGTIIAVGCPKGGEPGFPAWVSEDAVSRERANGPTKSADSPVGCLSDVIVSPLGIFAHGSTLLRSTDGRSWEAVEFLTEEGYSRGYVDAVFPTSNRLTVLLQLGAEAESTIASLFTTTEGATWEEVPAGSADLFDSSGVADVLATDNGLIAVGASPWGEFVPTAAAWASPDGIEWRLVTPQGEGFVDAYMHTIVETGHGYIAVGGSPFGTDLMAGWISADGANWSRLPSPTGDVAAEHGYMEAYAITDINTGLYAAGLDFDAGRSLKEIPALWVSSDGSSWERTDVDQAGGLIPFTIVGLGDRSIGFWPPPFWPEREPVQVFATSR